MRLSKSLMFSVILIVAILSLTILSVKPAYAQSITKPSIPEFTARYVDHSYDVPPTYGTDQYTGRTVVTKEGEHINNRTVEITIKNQLFTPFNDSDGNMINRFYDVRYKGSYTETWTTLFANQTQVAGIGAPNPYTKYGYAVQDYSSQYTTVIYQLTGQVPTYGQMDFQVEALEGYTYESYYDAHFYYVYYKFTFYGQESGWSNTETVQIGMNSTTDTQNSPSFNPTATPNVTATPTTEPTETPMETNTQTNLASSVSIEQIALIIACMVIVILAAALVVSHQKKRPV
jgi:hypothetical protein